MRATIAGLIAAALLFAPAARADDDRLQTDFAAANEKALAQDTEAAIALYQTLVDLEIDNEDLQFNLGNTYAESGDLVAAVIAYERALRMDPGDADARANLETVRAALRPKGSAELDGDPAVVADWVELLVAPFDAGTIGWIALFANATLFGLWYMRRRATSPSLRRWCAVGVATSMLLLLISGSIVLGHGVLARDPRAVATTRETMKDGPHARFEMTDAVHPGDRVRILAVDGDWVQIQRQQGTTGWVPVASITRV